MDRRGLKELRELHCKWLFQGTAVVGFGREQKSPAAQASAPPGIFHVEQRERQQWWVC